MNLNAIFLSEDSDLETYPPQRRKRATKKKIRKPPIGKVINAANKVGMMVTIKADGSIVLEGGQNGQLVKPNGHAIETADELRKLI